MSAYLRTKSIDCLLAETQEKGHVLKKVLGPLDVTMAGIGAIIGAGIFAMVGEAAAGAASGYPAGPSLMISFVLTSIACGFAALCYAEFAAMVPVSGSAYTYSYATMGELMAWIIGWDLIIEYAIGNVAVAISWAGYFNDFLLATFGIDIPLGLRMDYRSFAHHGFDLAAVPHIFGVPIVINLLAVSVTALLTIFLIRGVKESARLNDIMVAIKLLVLGVFVYLGFHYFKPENWVPFAPSGFTGIQKGAAMIFFAYIGFDAVSTVAEETKNPKRDMPLGILGSLGICTVIYVLVTAALTGMMPMTELKHKIGEPLVAALLYNHAANWLVSLVAFGAVVATTAVMLVYQMGQPRILFAMSRDGLLPKCFSKVHPKFGTPHVGTIITGLFVGGLSAFCSIDEMANLCNIGTLFAFAVVCGGVIILRIKDPDRPRPFKVPCGLLFPILGVLSCLFLMFGLRDITWLGFGAWLAIGLVIYFSYGKRNSRLNTCKQ